MIVKQYGPPELLHQGNILVNLSKLIKIRFLLFCFVLSGDDDGAGDGDGDGDGDGGDDDGVGVGVGDDCDGGDDGHLMEQVVVLSCRFLVAALEVVQLKVRLFSIVIS